MKYCTFRMFKMETTKVFNQNRSRRLISLRVYVCILTVNKLVGKLRFYFVYIINESLSTADAVGLFSIKMIKWLSINIVFRRSDIYLCYFTKTLCQFRCKKKIMKTRFLYLEPCSTHDNLEYKRTQDQETFRKKIF